MSAWLGSQVSKMESGPVIRKHIRDGMLSIIADIQYSCRVNAAQHDDAPDEPISRMDHGDNTQLSDHDLSINIDGALEALKSEAPSNNSGRSILRANSKRGPMSGRRARGGRGRGGGADRGRGRGDGRGRG